MLESRQPSRINSSHERMRLTDDDHHKLNRPTCGNVCESQQPLQIEWSREWMCFFAYDDHHKINRPRAAMFMNHDSHGELNRPMWEHSACDDHHDLTKQPLVDDSICDGCRGS